MRWLIKGARLRSAMEGCEPGMQFRSLEMADRELIAAILTAGMLPTMEIPQSRAQGKGRPLITAEADAIQRAVDHAFGLYRLVLKARSCTGDRHGCSQRPPALAPAVPKLR
jgi:hypothetical protein